MAEFQALPKQLTMPRGRGTSVDRMVIGQLMVWAYMDFQAIVIVIIQVLVAGPPLPVAAVAAAGAAPVLVIALST